MCINLTRFLRSRPKRWFRTHWIRLECCLCPEKCPRDLPDQREQLQRLCDDVPPCVPLPNCLASNGNWIQTQSVPPDLTFERLCLLLDCWCCQQQLHHKEAFPCRQLPRPSCRRLCDPNSPIRWTRRGHPVNLDLIPLLRRLHRGSVKPHLRPTYHIEIIKLDGLHGDPLYIPWRHPGNLRWRAKCPNTTPSPSV